MAEGSVTYILGQPHSFVDYLLAPLREESGYVVRVHRRRRTLGATLLRFVRSLLPGSHPGLWSRTILGADYVEFLSNIRPEDKLIFWAVGNKKDIRIIKEDVAARHVTSMLWDPLRQVCHRSRRKMRHYPEIMKRIGVRVCTFDPEDARNYGLDYVGQTYRFPDETDARIQHVGGEVFFIGVDKRRAPKLNEIAAELENEGIGYRFKLLFDKHSRHGQFPRLDACEITTPIPYSEVLNLTRGADCLLDILQPGQTGLTWRVLEAVFFGKKLITDNLNVKNEPFYRPENIYIIDDPAQPWPDIRTFLAAPNVPVPDRIIKTYDIRHWIKRL
ncbi:MAG: hypothetical protein K2M19_08440 [Muribaculaceae bacterium]|nr:hypothetical protein [Muribaculaceae bacterium]